MSDESRWKDWADDLVSKAQTHRVSQERIAEVATRESELKKQSAPQLWAATRDEMKSMCSALNERVGHTVLEWDSERGNQAIVRAVNTGQTLSANFDPERHSVEFRAPGESDFYHVVIQDGTPMLASVTQGRKQRPYEVAKRFVTLIASIAVH